MIIACACVCVCVHNDKDYFMVKVTCVNICRYSLPKQHDSPAFDIPDPDSFNTEE